MQGGQTLMDTTQFTARTNRLLRDLSSGSSTFNLSPAIIDNIQRANSDSTEINSIQKTDIASVSGKDFKIPKGASSMPYITAIGDNNSITLTTIEPARFKLRTGTAVRTPNREVMVPNNIAGFRREINNINKAAFSNGLNLDNFTLLNISNVPVPKATIKSLMNHGAVLPLGSKHGVFIPAFALKDSTFNSIEYEGRFVPLSRNGRTGVNMRSFDSMVKDPVKQDFGIDVTNLLSHSASPNDYSHRVVDDCSIGNSYGTQTKEVVLGVSNMSNLIMATHMVLSSWNKRGAVRDSDKIMDSSSGMHISATLPALKTVDDRTKASNYLNHAGLLIDALTKTPERWASHNYLGVRNTYNNDRAEFRLDPNTRRLEHRYPGTVFDISHITDQLIMANKITHDTEKYMRANRGVQPAHNVVPVDTSYRNVAFGGDSDKAMSAMRPLHNPSSSAHREMNQWFDKFMDVLGIDDPVQKAFVKGMNAKCVNSPRAER